MQIKTELNLIRLRALQLNCDPAVPRSPSPRIASFSVLCVCVLRLLSFVFRR